MAYYNDIMNYISEVARLRNTAIRHNFGNALYADYFADDALVPKVGKKTSDEKQGYLILNL